MPRLFVALPLPTAVTDVLAAVREPADDVRWVPPEQMHVTLRFLGDVPEDDVAGIEAALARVRHPAVALRIAGLGVFASIRRPRVLWAGLEDAAAVTTLHRRTTAALASTGIEPDRKAFHPHVTLARLKREPSRWVRSFLKRHGAVATPPFLVEAMHLYESVLHADGAEHRVRRAFPLRADARS